MIHLDTDIEGKKMTFGEAQESLKKFGFHMGGNWDYDRGIFDGVMHRENGETFYLRMPFQVLEGMLDRRDAVIEFEKPFVIKHVVNLGLDTDENSLLTVTGLGQFQEPLDTDGLIRDKSKWQEFGEETIGDILNQL
ncbi:YugN family protein [Ornithinibacillus sp. 4-3]|uniref:YugN family protein n=1 Tax=Ornithinibacillus sp. 4-3 TaxID=3231488 RepID=A0AB39HS42_9BACI